MDMCKILPFCTKVDVSQPIMVRFSIRKNFCNLQVGRIIKNETEMQFFNSIGPKFGTSVAPPSMKSTEPGLKNFNNVEKKMDFSL